MILQNQKRQFLIDDNGNRTAVILDIDFYEQLLEELEMQDDIKVYDKAKKKTDKEVREGKFVAFAELEAKVAKRLKSAKKRK